MKSYEFIYVYLDLYLYDIANIHATSRSKKNRARNKRIRNIEVYTWIPHYPYHPWCLYRGCQLKG